MTPEQELAELRVEYEDIKRRWVIALRTPRKEDLDKIKVLREACDLAVLNFQRSRPEDLYDDDHEAWAVLTKALEATRDL